MNDDELKANLRKTLEPVFDVLVDSTFELAKAIDKSLPCDMPADTRKQVLSTVLKNNADLLKESFKQYVPEDFEQKLKEELDKHGTKS